VSLFRAPLLSVLELELQSTGRSQALDTLIVAFLKGHFTELGIEDVSGRWVGCGITATSLQ